MRGRGLAASSWRSYHNERFGTTADVPADWRAGEPPENGDGLAFTSPDGERRSPSRAASTSPDTIAEAFATLEARRTTARRSPTITATSAPSSSPARSGDRIFYRKSILSCRDKVWNSVSIEYPAAEKKAYDALVTHVAGSLKAGASEQVAECP